MEFLVDIKDLIVYIFSDITVWVVIAIVAWFLFHDKFSFSKLKLNKKVAEKQPVYEQENEEKKQPQSLSDKMDDFVDVEVSEMHNTDELLNSRIDSDYKQKGYLNSLEEGDEKMLRQVMGHLNITKGDRFWDYIRRVDKDGKLVLTLDAIDFLTHQHEPIVMMDGTIRGINILDIEEEIILAILANKPVLYFDKKEKIVQRIPAENIKYIENLSDEVALSQKALELENLLRVKEDELKEKDELNTELYLRVEELKDDYSDQLKKEKILYASMESLLESKNEENVDVIKGEISKAKEDVKAGEAKVRSLESITVSVPKALIEMAQKKKEEDAKKEQELIQETPVDKQEEIIEEVEEVIEESIEEAEEEIEQIEEPQETEEVIEETVEEVEEVQEVAKENVVDEVSEKPEKKNISDVPNVFNDDRFKPKKKEKAQPKKEDKETPVETAKETPKEEEPKQKKITKRDVKKITQTLIDTDYLFSDDSFSKQDDIKKSAFLSAVNNGDTTKLFFKKSHAAKMLASVLKDLYGSYDKTANQVLKMLDVEYTADMYIADLSEAILYKADVISIEVDSKSLYGIATKDLFLVSIDEDMLIKEAKISEGARAIYFNDLIDLFTRGKYEAI